MGAKRLAVVGATLGMALAGPATTLAAAPTNPLSPGLPAPPVQTQTASTPSITLGSTTSSTDSGLSGGGAIAIALGAMLVLGGVAFYIWRDARRRAPVRPRTAEATAGASGRAGAKSRTKQRKLSPAERRRRKRGRAR